MDRRRFLLASLGGAIAAPLAAEAQPAKKMWRVGYLGDAPRAERLAINFEPFRDGLRELGYVEGQNIIIEERWTDGRAERLADLATELVLLKGRRDRDPRRTCDESRAEGHYHNPHRRGCDA